MASSLADLLAFAKAQARIESRDYIDPYARGELLAHQLSAWRSDKRRRDTARKACFAAFPGRLTLPDAERLFPGRYGRLSIDAGGSIDYTVGQYAPTEIYGAVLSYLKATNEKALESADFFDQASSFEEAFS